MKAVHHYFLVFLPMQYEMFFGRRAAGQRFAIVSHFYKTEATALTGFPV